MLVDKFRRDGPGSSFGGVLGMTKGEGDGWALVTGGPDGFAAGIGCGGIWVRQGWQEEKARRQHKCCG
jgi:hypothetical protein